MVDSLSKKDVFGRIGGEEFACFLGEIDEQVVVGVAEGARVAYSELSIFEPGFLSVSIGVVTTSGSSYLLYRLLPDADQAFYNEKKDEIVFRCSDIVLRLIRLSRLAE